MDSLSFTVEVPMLTPAMLEVCGPKVPQGGFAFWAT